LQRWEGDGGRVIVADEKVRYNGRWADRTSTGRASRNSDRGHAAVIDFLGLVVFMTVISIGLLDLKSGLGPFAMYRSGAVIGVGPQAPGPGRHGDDQQPRPPAPAQ
jgi:hypothetical protein